MHTFVGKREGAEWQTGSMSVALMGRIDHGTFRLPHVLQTSVSTRQYFSLGTCSFRSERYGVRRARSTS